MNAATGRSDRALRLTAAAVAAAAALIVISAGGNDGGGVRTDGQADTSFAEGRAEAVGAVRPTGRGPYPAGEAAATGTRTATCTTAQLALRVSEITDPPGRLVLGATNTSTTTCAAEGYPRVRFGQEQAAVPGDRDSRPGTAPTLAPGRTAYAGIGYAAAGGEGGQPRTAATLAVGIPEPGAAGDSGSVRLALPRELTVDDSALVTYWQPGVEGIAGAAPEIR
ncbi:hypothetical protein ACZ90_24980 [Streptomyces albus subsp. albus]|nr:hypothetical protein ACZ90_24980 [Streptomyces albus subsp. albus]